VPISLNMAPQTDAIDPVCGMTVPVGEAVVKHTHLGKTYHFCAEMCRRKFVRYPDRYLSGQYEGMSTPANARYICPMCPGVESMGPAVCPKCGMALEPEFATSDDQPDPELLDVTRRFKIGLLFAIPLLVLAMGDMFLPNMPISHALGQRLFLTIQAIFAIPVIAWCGHPIWVRFAQSLRNGSPNMFTLLGLGVGSATVYSFAVLQDTFFGGLFPESFRSHRGFVEPYFESAAVIVVLVLLGQLLELGARRRTGSAIRELMKLKPAVATVVMSDGTELEIPVELVLIGDRVRLRPGARVPVDGEVIEGQSELDESLLTGEPMPNEKTAGDHVIAGSINGSGLLLLRVEKFAEDSFLAKIVTMVGEAQRSRIPIQNLVDRMAAWFVPTMVIVSVLTIVTWISLGKPATGFVCGMSVLVIACPCALGFATPMAIVVGTGRAARMGVLFRDASSLERFAQVDVVVFDKTGTLTEGKPRVVVVQPIAGRTEEWLLTIAAAVEIGSEHPLGRAVLFEAKARNLRWEQAANIQTIPGCGISGEWQGSSILVGRADWLRQSQVSGVPEQLIEPERGTTLFLCFANQYVGSMTLDDELRVTSPEAIASLNHMGIRTVLLSGDRLSNVERVAAALNIPQVFADCLPSRKHEVIGQLQTEGYCVAMVGDGINDAPALAIADVGIAMGTGTDVAMTTAAMTLVRPDLRLVASARLLSEATLRIIRQNLFLAFIYNLLAVPAAAVGVISPMWAAAAMSLSSVSVILNSLRIARKR
jgi:P-type Cu+ transporter